MVVGLVQGARRCSYNLYWKSGVFSLLNTVHCLYFFMGAVRPISHYAILMFQSGLMISVNANWWSWFALWIQACGFNIALCRNQFTVAKFLYNFAEFDNTERVFKNFCSASFKLSLNRSNSQPTSLLLNHGKLTLFVLLLSFCLWRAYNISLSF